MVRRGLTPPPSPLRPGGERARRKGLRHLRSLLGAALVALISVGGGAEAAGPSPEAVGRQAAWVATSAVAQARKRPKTYWEKHHVYHLLDALILSSPLTGLAAAVLLFDPEVRQRPPGVLTGRIDLEGLKLNPHYRRRVARKLIAMIALATLSGLGLLTLLFHLLDLIPRI